MDRFRRTTTWRPHSDAPHHRQRRRLALAAVAAALVMGLGAVLAGTEGAGGAGQHDPSARRAARFLAALHAVVTAAEGHVRVDTDAPSDEAAAIDRTLRYTPYVRVAGAQHREVALTFDDGPGPYTPAILSTLERLHAPATFFEVGMLLPWFHVSTSRILADGFTLGDHTENHAPMSRLSRRLQARQLLEQASAIGNYGASFPRLFRPPYGLWNDTTLSLLHTYRMLMVLWTVDTEDYRRPGVAAIVHAAVAGARPGAIILLHDAGGDRSQTVAALPRVIRGLRARGYRLVTVPRLLLDNPAPRDQNVAGLVGSGG
jgi:peptidoglycan/xylan/chitin deacetylase (PgdA/CDA1 family)